MHKILLDFLKVGSGQPDQVAFITKCSHALKNTRTHIRHFKPAMQRRLSRKGGRGAVLIMKGNGKIDFNKDNNLRKIAVNRFLGKIGSSTLNHNRFLRKEKKFSKHCQLIKNIFHCLILISKTI